VVGLARIISSGKGGGLDEEEPVPVRGRELLVRELVVAKRGDDVEDHQLRHPVGVVNGQLMRHPRSSVVAAHVELLVAQRLHHVRAVGGQAALRVEVVL